ncbi:MAG: hypothetical protein RLZZ618_2938 [Pseudomonadota bacterium]|jgi:hypothetical protein
MNNVKSPARFDEGANRDPLSGAPGAHPVGTGLGAAAGGVALGAAIGTVAGPLGTLAGGIIGAVVGGLAGKGLAERIDPTAEDAYWEENFSRQPYADTQASYEEYRPAYLHGVEGYAVYPGRDFDEVESDLRAQWEASPASIGLKWERARPAARDAWIRLNERVHQGDSSV